MTSILHTREIDPADVYAGSINGTLQVRAWSNEMPNAGDYVSFQNGTYLVTLTNVPTPGGRATFHAMYVPPERL